jgi:type IV pilus assembly protein PilV
MIMTNFQIQPQVQQRGIVLLEVLIAVALFSFGMLGLVGLQAGMLKATSEAKFRAEAGAVAQKKVSELWTRSAADLANAVEAEPGIDISTTSGLPNGTRVTLRGGAGCDAEATISVTCFVVIVRWQQPNGDLHNVTTVAHVDAQS